MVDIQKNRLYITMTSDPDKTVLDKLYTDIRFGVADLKPGFDVITDLSNCKIGHLNGISTLRKIMNFLIANQVGQVVRIVGKKSLLFRQLIRLTSLCQGYSAAYVQTPEEAEYKLTHSASRDALRFRLHHQPIQYRINQQRGQGEILDISISGCAVKDPTIPLSVGMVISLSLELQQTHNTTRTFTITAKVVRSHDEMFAAQFIDLDDEQRKVLLQCLTYESQREVA